MKIAKRAFATALFAAIFVVLTAASSYAASTLTAVVSSDRGDTSEALYMSGSKETVDFKLPAEYAAYTVKSIKSGTRTVYPQYWKQSGGTLAFTMDFALAFQDYVIPLTVTCDDGASNTVELTGGILIRGTEHWSVAVKTPKIKTSDPSIDLTLSNKLPTLVSSADLVKYTGLPEGCFTSGVSGSGELGTTYEGGCGLSLEGLLQTFGTYTGYVGMQCVSGKTVKSGDILAIAYNVRGSYLVNISNGPVTAKETRVWKVLGKNGKRALTFTSTDGGFRDGTYAIFRKEDEDKTDVVSLGADDQVSGAAHYVLVVFIKDNGDLDLARDEDYLVVDPIVVEQMMHKTQNSGSGGGGCSATGGALMLAAAALVTLRARRRARQ